MSDYPSTSTEPLPLFADAPPDPKTMARREHPDTSHKMAKVVADSDMLSEDETTAFDLVWKYPARTAKELDKIFCPENPDQHKLGRRLGAMRRSKKLLVHGPRRECSVGHNLAITWYLREAYMRDEQYTPATDTCTGSPRDRDGELIRGGMYERQVGKRVQRIVVIEDPEMDSLFYRPAGCGDAAPWIRIEESNPNDWRQCRRVEAQDQ